MSVTIIDFLLLEHDANVPLEYAAFLTQDCWNDLRAAYTNTHIEGSRYSRSLELLICCLSGACCIFFIHPYLDDNLAKARLTQKLSVLNRIHFQKRRVLTSEQDGIYVNMDRLQANGEESAPGAYPVHRNLPIQRTIPCKQYPSAEVTIILSEPSAEIPYADSVFSNSSTPTSSPRLKSRKSDSNMILASTVL